MADAVLTDDFSVKLKETLRESLHKLSIDANILVEPIPTTRLCRVFVITQQRDRLEHTEWKQLIDKIMKCHFTPEDELRISTFYTVTPEEFNAYQSEEESALL